MKRRIWTGTAAAAAMLVLILDVKTGLYGAVQGVELCVRTLIPSLFPFFVLSVLLTNSLSGVPIPLSGRIFRLCGIPRGAEGLFLTGILGGYPTGAQAVAQAYENGFLDKASAQRMLGFFSNAGPSFLFGIAAARFSRMRLAWVLWGIHLLSAVLTGILLPGKTQTQVLLPSRKSVSMLDAVKKSLYIMAQVCGWVILSRVLIAFCQRWFLWLLPAWAQATFVGLLELSNGCMELGTIPQDGLRFVLCAGLLGFGGLCVLMQTLSVTGTLGLGMYLQGKLLQSFFSMALAGIAQYFLFDSADTLALGGWQVWALAAVTCVVIPVLYGYKKRSSIPAEIGV